MSEEDLIISKTDYGGLVAISITYTFYKMMLQYPGTKMVLCESPIVLILFIYSRLTKATV